MIVSIVYTLARPTVRAMNWGPFAAGVGLSFVVLVVPEVISDTLTAAHLTTLLRVAAACVALGAAFLLDDPATRSTPTMLTSQLIRNAMRVAITVPVVGVWWAAALVVTTIGAGDGVAATLPRGALTLEAAALVALALTIASIGQRFSDNGSAGIVAAPTVLILFATVWFLPARVALVPALGDPQWTPAHRRWAALLAVTIVCFAWASREPAAHRMARRPSAPPRRLPER